MKKFILLFSSLLTMTSYAQECFPVRTAGGFYNTSLSHYFAQEYTGADIVREELIKTNTEIPSSLVAVIDSVVQDHGYRVMNLISSPTYSAAIPQMTPGLHEKFNLDYFINGVDKKLFGPMIWLAYAKRCASEKNCPSFMNMSMFVPRTEWFDVLKNMTSQKIIVVAAAGNDLKETNDPVPDLSNEASDKYNFLLVGSSSPTGGISLFSRSSDRVVIAAPSEYDVLTGGLLSRDQTQNTYERFSGTSGAAPQVTSALVIFEAISGYHPTLAEAKKLLVKSAIKLRDATGLHGKGNLNTLKIFEVAKKIKQECGLNQACVSQMIENDETYKLKINAEELSMSKNVFANCFNLPKRVEPNCDKKKEALKNLRKFTLLNSSDKVTLKGLACIYKSLNLAKNASYYDRLSNL